MRPWRCSARMGTTTGPGSGGGWCAASCWRDGFADPYESGRRCTVAFGQYQGDGGAAEWRPRHTTRADAGGPDHAHRNRDLRHHTAALPAAGASGRRGRDAPATEYDHPRRQSAAAPALLVFPASAPRLLAEGRRGVPRLRRGEPIPRPVRWRPMRRCAPIRPRPGAVSRRRAD